MIADCNHNVSVQLQKKNQLILSNRYRKDQSQLAGATDSYLWLKTTIDLNYSNSFIKFDFIYSVYIYHSFL